MHLTFKFVEGYAQLAQSMISMDHTQKADRSPKKLYCETHHKDTNAFPTNRIESTGRDDSIG